MPSSKNRPVRSNRRSLGREYESRAADFYQSQGFTILDRNWQASHREVDLIVHKDDLLVFVEVKASRTQSFGHPAGWVSRAKRRHMTVAAQLYVEKRGISGCDIRFDVVCFVNGTLEHFSNAFEAEED